MATRAQFYEALPAYLGGKRRLAPLICSEVARMLPQERGTVRRLLDPFCGGGALALTAKYVGFEVIASDIAVRAVVMARALIANSQVRLSREDVLGLFQQPVGDYKRIAELHSPRVFAVEQAAWLDRALAQACTRAEPKRSLLQLLIIKLTLMANRCRHSRRRTPLLQMAAISIGSAHAGSATTCGREIFSVTSECGKSRSP
jgi:hypothetical protein